MALTPEQLAELQRLRQMFAPLAEQERRRQQAAANAEAMANKKAKGGSAKDKALKLFMKGTKAKERLYHGTGNLEALTAFDPASTGKGVDQLGSGFYLSNDPEEASGYAGERHSYTGEKNPSPGVIPAHVAIRNPIKLGKKANSLNDARVNLTHDQIKQIMEHVPNLRHPERSPLYNHVDTSRGVTPHMINDIAKLYTGNALHALENDMFYDNPTAYRTALNKVLGYDGVVKDFGNGRKHYVAWFPNQIKSAIGNRGTYDPNSDDLTMAKGGNVSTDGMRYALTMQPKHMAYGGPARNWAPGEEAKLKKHMHSLKLKDFGDPYDEKLKYAQNQLANNPNASESIRKGIQEAIEKYTPAAAVNQWLDSVAHNYIKKQMATEKDPVRHHAENDVFHMNLPEEPSYWHRKGETRRKVSGGEQIAKSDKAKSWENRTDAMLEAEEAQAHQDMMHLAPGMYSEKDEWIKKLDPTAKLWSLTEHFDPADLGLDHIRDVLHEDLMAGRIRPEQLSKISMAQAVQRAHQYDQEMEKKRQETAIKQTEGMPTVHDYPEEGMKWIELAPSKEKKAYSAENLPSGYELTKDRDGYYQVVNRNVGETPTTDSFSRNPDEAIAKFNKWLDKSSKDIDLERALKYEGEAMGHCVGGYCPEVTRGEKRIFSLRDKKGEPHVTIETAPAQGRSSYEDMSRIYDQANQEANDKNFNTSAEREHFYHERVKQLQMDLLEKQVADMPHRIVQIKGKGNAKPHKKYIPHVQHFVKSGKWSDIGDYRNTDLRRSSELPELEMFKAAGMDVPEHVSAEEHDQLINEYNRRKSPPAEEGWLDKLHGNKGQKMKQGGQPSKAKKPTVDEMKRAIFEANQAGLQRPSEVLGQHEGKYLHLTEADRAAVENRKHGLRGGVGFSQIGLDNPEYAGRVWGVGKPGVVSKLLNKEKRGLPADAKSVWSTFIGSPDMHTSNQLVFNRMWNKFQEARKAGKLSPEQEQVMLNMMRQAMTKEGKNIFDPDVNFDNSHHLFDTFERRRILSDLMAGNKIGGKKGQIFDASKVIEDTTDPKLLHAPTFSVGPHAFEFSGETSHEPHLNKAFPHMLHGTTTKHAFKQMPFEMAVPEYMAMVQQLKGRKPGYMDIVRNIPRQHISEKYLTGLQKAGYAEGGEVDIAEIGVNEAPNLDVKAYSPFAFDGSQEMPFGGVDMDPAKAGAQLMSAQTMKDAQQGAQQPPNAPPRPANPQGSNILQMTPQGQAMAAMRPAGQAPAMPAGKKRGGKVTMPSIDGMRYAMTVKSKKAK